MFKNVGQKIQTVVSVVFFITVVLSCLAGIGVGMLVNGLTHSAAAAILIGIVIAGIGIFVSWLSQLLLFAYGKIAQSCEEQTELLRHIAAGQAPAVPAAPPFAPAPAPVQPAVPMQGAVPSVQTVEQPPAAAAAPAPQQAAALCGSCGYPLEQNAKFCPYCGRPVG